MLKCFLSHSSKDKKGYVDIVAKLLKGYVEYDQETFEAGLKNFDEILRGLSQSEIFVIFISENSLRSTWVKKEITLAEKKLSEENLLKIYPLIIDPNINHEDERIPQWMKDEYNIRYISRPAKASQLIRQRLLEMVWEKFPKYKQLSSLCVGRNDIISSFEERYYDFEQEKPTCIIASGIREIGRWTVLRQCCVKTGIFRETYVPPSISLAPEDSLEDFIIKLYDLSLSAHYELSDLLEMSQKDKVDLALKVTKDIQNNGEFILIRDTGCVVGFNGVVSPWFLDLLYSIHNEGKPLFLVTTNIWPNLNYHARQRAGIYDMRVPGLEPKERKLLLSRYADIREIESLSLDDFQFFSDILTGYPGQVKFAVDIISENGIEKTRKDNNLLFYIKEYSSRRAQNLLLNFENNPELQEHMEFLTFLCEFDFVSRTLVAEILGDLRVGGKNYIDIIEEFIRSSLCEEFGTEGEYIRVNDPIRDYIRRNKNQIPRLYHKQLRHHLDKFLETYHSEEKDTSDLFYSLKQALVQGRDVDSKYLVPSHYLRAIRELYDQKKRYRTVIELSDRVLANEYALENRIVYRIKLYLCLSLARQKDGERFFGEIQYFRTDNSSIGSTADYHFLKGFYFRLKGNLAEAEAELQQSIEISDRDKVAPTKAMASRDLVQVLISLEEYDRAKSLAASNYEESPSNPFHIQAYFDCIFNSADKSTENRKILVQLLDSLDKINSDKAREFHGQLQAKYIAIWGGKKIEAFNLIDEVIARFRDSFYAKKIRFDIAVEFNDFHEMEKSLSLLGDEDTYDSPTYRSYVVKAKAVYQAKQGNINAALLLIDKEFSNFSTGYRDRLRKYLRSLQPSA